MISYILEMTDELLDYIESQDNKKTELRMKYDRNMKCNPVNGFFATQNLLLHRLNLTFLSLVSVLLLFKILDITKLYI